jgi:maltose O-acetyltransferase
MISRIKYFIFDKMLVFKNQYEQYQKKKLKESMKSCGSNVIIAFPIVMKNLENITLGSNITINPFCHFWGTGGITIGNNVMIASHCAITSITHSKEAELFREKNILKEVVIGDNVWIGTHAVILPGVTIGKNSIIGAGAVVTKNIPDNSVYIGVPAQKHEDLRQFLS